MKIAVILLLLGISSFIETSNGHVSKLNPLDKNKADHYVRCLELAVEKNEFLKKCPEQKCPEHEKKTREICLVEDLMHTVKLLAVDLQCTVEDVLELLELPLNVLELLKLGQITSLLDVINVEKLLFSVTRLVEGLLAQVNILLKSKLTTLCDLLGNTLSLVVLPLHGSLAAVTASLAGTVLGAVTGLVGVVVAPLNIVGNLLGGLGG